MAVGRRVAVDINFTTLCCEQTAQQLEKRTLSHSIGTEQAIYPTLLKSGAYITVETALEQGRDVFAVPGELYNPLSEGPHQLLKEGAQMITCAEDVLASYGIHKEAKKKSRKSNKSETKNENNAKPEEQQMTLFQAPPTPDVPLTSEEERVLGLFTTEPLSIEEAAYLAKLPMSELMAILSMLELYGLIEPMVGRKYIRIG